MDQKQPNVVNVRNGPSRGRSRSISRRSRSRSPPAAPRELLDGDPSLWLAAPAAPLNPAPWGKLAPAPSPFGAAPSMSSLARSGTVDRGRAQRARYLGDDVRTGRSRSVSRSRSRSRSPSPGVRPLPQHPKHAFPEPTAFVMMQSQSDIATYSERKVTLSYDQVDRFVRTGEVGPKTRFAIHLLFNAAFIVFIGPGTTFEHDAAHPFPVGQLAMLCDPIVMPLPILVNLIYSVYQAEAAAEAAAPSRQSTNDNPDWVRI